jgi:hypothetical protein
VGGALSLLSLTLFFSCGDATGRLGLSKEAATPVTVSLGAGSARSVTDFQAHVKVFQSNDRIANSEMLRQSYKISTKIIGDLLYARIDYEADPSLGLSRKSVVTGPSGTVVFDADTGTIEQRLPARAHEADAVSMKGRSLFERVDIARLREMMRGLGYDITDSEGKACDHLVSFSAPSALLPKSALVSRATASFKVMFDADEGVMAGSELVETEVDGTIVTTTVTKYYQEEGDIMVPVGERLDVHYDIPGSIAVDGSAYPRIDADTELPTMSPEEFAALQATGEAYEVPEAVLGDPSDPDRTETWLTVYESVATNCLSDSLFKIVGLE